MSRDVPPTLVCRVRDLRIAIDLAFISETMRPLPVSPIADMPSFIAGLAVVRGVPTVVVDTGALLTNAGPRAWTRFVALRSTAGPVALAVEAVIGVRALDVPSLHALSPLLAVAHTETVAAIGVRDRELLVLLDAARIVPDSVWTTLERAEVPA